MKFLILTKKEEFIINKQESKKLKIIIIREQYMIQNNINDYNSLKKI